MLTEKHKEVGILAEALLDKEVLFQSDVETLIGKRPYEEKRAIDVTEHTNGTNAENGSATGKTVNPSAPEEVKQ